MAARRAAGVAAAERADAMADGHDPRRAGDRAAMEGWVVALVLLLCAGWGGLAPAIKVALREVPPVALAGWRFLIGILAILLWCAARGIAIWPERRHWPTLGVIAVMFVAQIALLNAGTRFTSAGHSTLLLATHPLFVAVFVHFVLHDDRLSTPKALGLLLAFAGVAAVVAERLQGGSFLGDALVCVSAVLLGALVTITKWAYRRGLTPYQVLAGQIVPGVAGFFLVSRALEGPVVVPVLPASWVAILYQGLVVAGFGFAAWNSLLDRYAASRLAAFQFTVPIFGVVFSAWILGERLTAGVALGTLLVGAGLLIANRSRPGAANGAQAVVGRPPGGLPRAPTG
ncbi:MAG: DMT family transporter [Armatimonadetes bacterium]|nr:DMT family transporter [Armatimonadota bacterium]